MRTNRIKLPLIVVFVVLVAVVIGFKTNESAASLAFDDDPAAVYKAKCAMCHSPKAEKHFDLTKSDEHHVDIILKGKKDAKPPMPEFASKGITPDQAQALVAYMRGLREPGGANTNVNAANANVNANTNVTVNANTTVNGNANSNANTVVNADTNANANTNANATVNRIPTEEIAAMYKSKCAMCHSPKAEKAYNPELPLEEQINIILKGKKAAKPPHMPGYEDKGVTAEHARALAEYMKSLRTAGK